MGASILFNHLRAAAVVITMNAQAHLRIVPHPANVGTLLENGWRVPRTTQLKSGGQARSAAAHHRLRIEEAHQETL